MKLLVIGLDGIPYWVMRMWYPISKLMRSLPNHKLAERDAPFDTAVPSSVSLWGSLFCGKSPVELGLGGRLSSSRPIDYGWEMLPLPRLIWQKLKEYKQIWFDWLLHHRIPEDFNQGLWFKFHDAPQCFEGALYASNVELSEEDIAMVKVKQTLMKQMELTPQAHRTLLEIEQMFLDGSYYSTLMPLLTSWLSADLTLMNSFHNKVPDADLVCWYTWVTDKIMHHSLMETTQTTTLAMLKVVEEHIKELVDTYKPENVLIMSDHGNALNSSLAVKQPGLNPASWKWTPGGYLIEFKSNHTISSAEHSADSFVYTSGELTDRINWTQDSNIGNNIYDGILKLFGVEK